MNRRVILLHGFNVRDGGENTVGKLKPYLAQAGFSDVLMPSYGWFGLLSTAGFNDNLASFLAGLTQPGDVIIAHSNGCAMAYRALRDHPECGAQHLVFINPALKPKVAIPDRLKALQIWHNKGDKAVEAARLFSLFTLWGNMGAVGYRGPKDRRVWNFDKREMIPPCTGHSDVFSDDLVKYYGPLIVRQMKKAMNLMP